MNPETLILIAFVGLLLIVAFLSGAWVFHCARSNRSPLPTFARRPKPEEPKNDRKAQLPEVGC